MSKTTAEDFLPQLATPDPFLCSGCGGMVPAGDGTVDSHADLCDACYIRLMRRQTAAAILYAQTCLLPGERP